MPVVLVIPIAAVLLALVAVLVHYGGHAMAQLVGHLIPNWSIPLVGNIRSAVIDSIDDAIAAVDALFDDALIPVVHLITSAVEYPKSWLSGIAVTLRDTYAAIERVVTVTIPAQVLTAIHEAQHLYNLVEADLSADIAKVTSLADHLYNLAIAAAAADAADVLHQAQHLYNLAVAYAQSAADTVLGDAQHLYNLAIAYAANSISALDSKLSAAIADIDNYAHAAIATVTTDLANDVTHLSADIASAEAAAISKSVAVIDAGITAGLTDLYPGIVDAVHDVTEIAADGFADIMTGIKAIPASVPSDALGVASLAGATALALTRYLDDCGVPNCRNLSAFGRELAALLAVVNDLAFIAFLAECINDPAQGAQDMSDVFGGLGNAAVGTAKSLLGVSW